MELDDYSSIIYQLVLLFYSVARRLRNLIKVKHLISSPSIMDQSIAAVMKPNLS